MFLKRTLTVISIKIKTNKKPNKASVAIRSHNSCSGLLFVHVAYDIVLPNSVSQGGGKYCDVNSRNAS